MANKLIYLTADTTVRADEITKVWVSNNSGVFVKLREGATHTVDRQYGETPFQASARIKAQIEAALA